ncbi:MAG: bifunctional UDP-N-acetylmuramoyl-tripeptide:D-alanyl-D-alanine ligase/alanine racemase [Prevotellaceae bacterium]|jgi:alanine racemase|nr:bifunctional UDP-N-acetylmuramoyl-tripeptide:D-alanyl-D-alanine ligase/alanine racemase [Prevotellaceae bacterium]
MQNHRYNIANIAVVLKAELHSSNDGTAVITSLLTDSRSLAMVDGCLFFALVTARNDGHKYIASLYEKGLRHFVVNHIPEEMKNARNVDFLLVPDTLLALQQLAANYRLRFTIPVVGITGSNGKTIVKEWLSYLLSDTKKVVKSPKSYNSQIGVPLSVWQMRSEDEIAIFEAGISQPEEMMRIQKIIQPTIGILTNIGAAHDEYFDSREQKLEEKLKLFSEVETLIYFADQKLSFPRKNKDTTYFSWGQSPISDLKITFLKTVVGKTTVNAQYQGTPIQFTLPFPDKASFENAMHCFACMLALGYPPAYIADRMCTLPAIEMRMDLKGAINNCAVINDSYSSDYNGLQIAVDFLAQQQQYAKKTVILSDILESGRNLNDLYEDVARLLQSKNISRVIGIGPEISRQAEKFSMEKLFYPDTAAFLRDFPFSSLHNETILLKGARVFAFEQIDEALQQQAHETVMEINLNALAYNLNCYRSKLLPGVKLMAMVKAFSYGSGSCEIANLLQFHRVDYLSVAYADEGVELRKSGITMPIMVMNPEEQSLAQMLEYNLEPEIYSFRVLALLKEKLAAGNRQSAVAIHIKLDTGMHRLGFEEKEIPALIQELKMISGLHIASVFSHLATGDEARFDEYTNQQIAAFKKMSQQLQDAFSYPITRHLLNSAGISRLPDAQFDMVRLGIGLYGIGVDEVEQKQLENVSTLKTIISQIRHIPAGDAVGYARAFIAPAAMTIGVIPIGYADGLHRLFGNGRGRVLVNGQYAPVIGNVCMDMCMIDLSGIEARENDEVIIFGEKLPITEIANVLETIPYEVLTSVGRRVKRVYFQE